MLWTGKPTSSFLRVKRSSLAANTMSSPRITAAPASCPSQTPRIHGLAIPRPQNEILEQRPSVTEPDTREPNIALAVLSGVLVARNLNQPVPGPQGFDDHFLLNR